MGNWREEVKRDLMPFVDPGTPITYSEAGRYFTAEWTARRTARRASFLQKNDEIIVSFGGAEMSYRAFLSSAPMSDLLGVAGMMLQVSDAKFFVDTQGMGGSPSDEKRPALQLLREKVMPAENDFTSVIFVTGEAGAGKTEVLRHLVRQQAELYSKGQADYLFLYVNAQGRALARLDEALATEIQDLRATSLTYHLIPTLTRNGVLVPVIDGFDELLGVLGYEDSFSSLRRFLDELEGQGSLIASARSTYYQQELLSRAGRGNFLDQGIIIDPIEIMPWSEHEFREYINLRYHGEKTISISFHDFKEKMESVFAQVENRILKQKPFFVAKAADMVLHGRDVSGGNLLEQLVEGYIERERSEKLLDRNGVPLLDEDQIRKFVQLVCEEMWTTETRSIDGESIRLLAELVFPVGDVPEDAARILRERAAMMAFFAPSVGRAKLEFEHELFFSFFLGDVLAYSVLEGEDQFYALVSRGKLPEYASTLCSKRLLSLNADIHEVVLRTNQVAKRGAVRSVQTRENAGGILNAFLIQLSCQDDAPKLENIRFEYLVFAGGSFGKITLYGCYFFENEFRRTDLSGARFIGCLSAATQLQEVVVDPSETRLEMEGLDPEYDVFGLRVRDGEDVVQIFRPDSIVEVLIQCGLKIERKSSDIKVDDKVLSLLERLMRKFERSNLFWPEDSENGQITSDALWPRMRDIMEESRVAVPELGKNQKGTPRPAIKLNYLPQQIMAARLARYSDGESVSRFWEALRHEFPRKN